MCLVLYFMRKSSSGIQLPEDVFHEKGKIDFPYILCEYSHFTYNYLNFILLVPVNT